MQVVARTAVLAIVVFTIVAVLASSLFQSDASMPPARETGKTPETMAEAAARPAALLAPTLDVIYRAFALQDEAAIYDSLATVATGTALETLYLQRRGELHDAAAETVSEQQGITEIEVKAADAQIRGDLLSIEATWLVSGVVGHADHEHMRSAAFSADIDFALQADGWRIVAFDLLDIQRTAPEPPHDETDPD